jgi:uncharacterized protein YdaU (DUF1376 family)
MGKYARDTKHLSMAEHGAYNLLLDYYYSTGGLPQVSNADSNAQLMPDHSRIYRVCSATGKAEQDAVDSVLKFFFTANKQGFYINEKCEEVIAEQTLKHENRVRAGSTAKHKQCSSNALQTQTKTKKESPLPPKGGTAAPGGFKNGLRGEGGSGFNIEPFLSDDDRAAAKAAAPGWDLYFLIRTYDEGSAGRGRPKYPGKAFVAWCASYTKGKKP